MLEHLAVDVSSDAGVVEHPVLINTSAGVFGATITSPEDRPRAALAILVGLNEERSGANAIWRVMAQTFARLGVVVLRYDSAGVCDSHLALEGDEGDAATLEVVRWFAQETNDVPLLLLGYCKGVKSAVTFAVEDPAPFAVALVSPPKGLFAPLPITGLKKIRASVSALLKKSPPPSAPTDIDEAASFLDRTPPRSPTWMLLGTDDRAVAEAQDLARSGRHGNRLSLEVIDGVEVHWFTTPSIQQEVMTRVVSWIEQVLMTIPKGTL